ncbi:acyl-CoA dehydrogenase [Bordetella trematum]|nr:acyl-CoA dehydrogenase [Bordetella trematum]
MSFKSAFAAWRRKRIAGPAYRWARAALPGLSATEREAIEAGDVWWEGDLFTGNPDWNKLMAVPAAALTPAEQDFIDGPLAQLCGLLDEWDIEWKRRDLPAEVWALMRRERFFGMIIPTEYGGLGFSPYAHSEVVRRLSAYSITAGVTVMVPNSLGPGELLLQFGTPAQRDFWLPRLADGREIPCFGLTSPEAGSDAASMTDTGIVCRQVVEGEERLGIRLNWRKRYITLGPVATVLGLAFKLRDPDGLLGGEEDIGISVALVPTDAPGVEIGRRHVPSMQMFQNGPTCGRDVFVPIEALIGGPARAGQGWQMLMSALAAGRGISLPSLSAAGAVMSAHTTGMYARVRQQFGIPVGRFEGVQEKLARLAGHAYLVEAARRLTCAALNQGHKPAVASAIMKYHATERLRVSVNDAMDVHGGKAVIDGPRNYLGALYRALPIAITVEGANILTRCLIVFGQGAIRAHPYLMREVTALGEHDEARGRADFEQAFWQHLRHGGLTLLRAWGRAWTAGGWLPPASRRGEPALPPSVALRGRFRVAGRRGAGDAGRLAQASRDALGAVGRCALGAVSAVGPAQALGRRRTLPCRPALVAWGMEEGCLRIEQAMDLVLSNLPNRPAAIALRVVVLPMRLARGPGDALTRECAQLLLQPSATRDRLTADLKRGGGGDAIGRLEDAFARVSALGDLLDRLRREGSGIGVWRGRPAC